VAFTATLNHLSPGTTYLGELVASNGDGTTTARASFRTESLVRPVSASTGKVLLLRLARHHKLTAELSLSGSPWHSDVI
jgi:hypothetical protein